MKYLIFILVFLLLALYISADTLVPIEVEVVLEFDDERDFTLELQNGYRRHFIWDENKTHSDVTFTHTIYEQLDETEWCSDNSELDEYKKIVENEAEMIKICGSVMTELNKSVELTQTAEEAIKDRDIYENMFEGCDMDKLEARNQSKTWENKYNKCDEDKEECRDDLLSARSNSGDVKDLKSQLSQAINSKNTWGFGGVCIGLLIGYFMWKRKKGQGPSEQVEAGQSYDQVNTEFNQSPDGPKQ